MSSATDASWYVAVPSGPQQRRAVAGEPNRAVLVALGSTGGERSLHCLGIDGTALALSYRAVVEVDVEPFEVGENRALPALDVPRRIGVVDP